MNLYVIRHGQSQANADNQLAGWLNVPLTEKGFDDARRAGEKIKDIEFEQVFASDLTRASQTCETALPSRAYTKEHNLRELSVGAFEGLYYDDRTPRETHVKFEKCCETRDFSGFDGESHQMQLDRVSAFMNKIAETCTGNVAAFTHAGTLECIINHVLGFRIPGERFAMPNCVICVFEWDGANWRLKHWNI